MAGLYDGLELAPGAPPAAPAPPKAPPGLYDGLELAPVGLQTQPRAASGLAEHVQSGFQASAPGLAWRGKVPDLVMNKETAKWWERLATGVTQVASDLPIMIPAGQAGAAAGGAAAGPVGGILAGGAAMFAAPALIRESLIQAYKAGDVMTAADWFNAVREVATHTLKEGAIGAVTMGAGAVVRGGAAAAMGGTAEVARAVGLGTATMATRGTARVAGAADVAGQIAAMVTMPAALEGRLPDAMDFVDATAVILTLKAGHVAVDRAMAARTKARITDTYLKTGKTPAEQVAEAQADPRIAEELTAEVPRGTDGRVEMPTVQEALFREVAKLDELRDLERSGLLSTNEQLEIGLLRERVRTLERTIRDSAPPAPPDPTFTPDQVAEARARAAARAEELAAKAETGALTDAERVERVVLANATPEGLARHFRIEPAAPSRDTFEASARAVYDDVLRQAQDANEARRAAGIAPLGEENLRAAATIVMHEVRTYADMHGVLPEAIYRERYLTTRDETQARAAAVEAAIPPEAPRFVPPEVDLFGNPVETTNVPRFAVENMATVELPLANLVLSKEVPQFKAAADAEGVVVKLGGKFDRTGVGPIQVWERLDGTMEVISGRHRLDLARRSGEETIPAQVHREADGFDARKAATLDAQLNIREEQGSVADYAQYFKDAGLSKEAADELGLLARAKGRTGFAIARDASGDVLAAHRAGLLSDEAALSISQAAPGSERLQALGISMINEGKSHLIAVNTMKAVEVMAAERQAAGTQGDIFGFDDSAMREASAMAKKASSIQRKIGEQIAAVSGASKRPEIARKMGVNVEDPAAVQAKIVELRQEQYLWDNWPLYPELVAKLRAADTLKQAAVRAESARDWTDAPLDESAYISRDDYHKALNPYVKDGLVVANSRTTPNENAFPPIGTWRIDTMRGSYGREIEKLVEIPIVSLRLGELDSQGRLDPVKAGDDVRYAEWLKEGRRAPPIEVVQTEEGALSVTDGHRRALAAQLAGAKTVEAWVNFAVPVPEGLRYDRNPTGKLIRTGMTHEMLTGEVRNPYLDRIPLEMSFDLKPETPAELKARDEEAVAQARRKLAQEAAADRAAQGKPPTVDQADLFNTQGTLFQSTPGPIWYSELAAQLEASTMKQAPAKGWKDLIKGMKGVKADEVKWSGIEEWLDLQEGKVTKEQVRQFVEANGVKVQEKMLGSAVSVSPGLRAAAFEFPDGHPTTPEGWIRLSNSLEQIAQRRQHHNDHSNAARYFALAEEAGRHAEGINADTGSTAGQPKFGQYQLPGAKEGTYRELLLTLPVKAGESRGWQDYRDEMHGRGISSHAADEVRRHLLGAPHESIDMPAALQAERTMGEAWVDRYRDVLQDKTRRPVTENSFQSSHFDESNILAHVRFNERTDAEGKRVLFVEEVQSDWAQKGKREGFAGSEQARSIPTEDSVAMEIYGRPYEQLDAATRGAVDTELDGRLQGGGGAAPTMRGFAGVPAAPFVGKTEAWVALTLKRMIRYAAENGFERVAWTTGEQQVSRYTQALRHQVDAIEWKKTPEGVQLVGYKGRGGDRMTDRESLLRNRRVAGNLTAEQARELQTLQNAREQAEARTKVVDTTEKETALSDAIGKAMAEKIIKDPNQSGTIEGEGIKIDDTGMAGFYDRIVPNIAKDVLKKLGGGKVGEVEFMGRKAVGEREPDGAGGLVQRTVPAGWGEIDTATPGGIPQGPRVQQGFDITPAMREKALAGQPLFQEHRGSYQVAERLVTLFEKADATTLVHEFSHHFLENLKHFAAKPNAPQRVKEMWETARQEFAIPESGEIPTAGHELNARSFERYLGEGEAPSVGLRGVFAQFKAWMLEIYNDLRNIGAPINPAIRSLFDRMLATDEEIAAARELNVPRSYVAAAKAEIAAKVVTPPEAKKPPEPGFIDEQLAMEPFAEELAIGPGSGATRDSRVNAQYINGPMDLKLAIQQVANRDQANIQARRGGTDGVKSWEQANAHADKVVEDTMGGKMVREGPEDGIPHDIKQRAAFKVMVAVAKYSLKLRDEILAKGDNATIQDQFDYLNSIVRLRMTHAEFLGLRAESARALNQIRDMTPESGVVDRMVELTSGRPPQEMFQELFQAAKTAAQEAAELKIKLEQIMTHHFSGKGALDIAKLHKDVKDLKSALKFSKEVTDATTWEMVIEGWRAMLLTGPQTPVTNVLGTLSFQFLRPAVDVLAATIGMARGASPGRGETDRASMSEAVARIAGMLSGVQDGLKLAWHELKRDEPTEKVESYRNAIPGPFGELMRFSYRVMSAGDVLTTTMFKRGEMATLAIRDAFDKDLNPSSREFAEHVQKIKNDPPPEIEAEAAAAAARAAFNMPGGEKTVALQGFVRNWGLQWMIPFIRTPINITAEAGRMTPFAPLVVDWRADFAKGGVARDKAIAEVVIGAGIMALTMAYAFEGQITGSGDPDPGKNRGKTGVWQANSVLIGDTYYEIGRLQPGGTLMVLAADVANAWDHMTDEEKDKVPKILARAFANAVTNQTFLQGITNVVNAMSDPARFGPKFVQQLAASLVPNFIGQPTTMADPYVREVNSMMEAIQARLPMMRQQLEPKLDWLGKPTETKERMGYVLPVREQKISEDKVRLEAARLDISMAAAPKKTHIGKGTGKLGDVELTPAERNAFQKVGGEMAHKILDNIVNAEGYDEIPDLVKRRIFARVLTASHQVAAVAALPMDKRLSHLQSISEKIAAELMPQDEQ